MHPGTTYLATSALRALSTANARKPLTTTGLGSVAAFLNGLPTSELPLPMIGLHAASAGWGLLRGVHRTTAGRIGLALTAVSAAGLFRLHRATADADELVERSLIDELGADYPTRLAANPMAPTTSELPLVPTGRLRDRYCTDAHIAYDTHGRRTTLDIWHRPDLADDARAPVLVQVHGGGWVFGDKTGQAYPLMVHMAERGWVCVSITYRLSPKATWPDHVVDVKRALAWVKDNIADYGGDPDWVAITGGSAGGHLSSLAALTPNDPQFQPGFEDADTSVRACVPFYGIYDWTNRDGTCRDDVLDLLERRIVKKTLADEPDIYDQASPMSHVSADAVPFLFVHGANDSLVPVEQGRAMVDAMRKASANPVVYVEFPGAQHAFDVFGSPRTRAIAGGVERFLNLVRSQSGRT